MPFVCHPKSLHKHCLQFLLGVKMAPRETEKNAYEKFWGDKQRPLWHVMVFLEWAIASTFQIRTRIRLRTCSQIYKKPILRFKAIIRQKSFQTTLLFHKQFEHINTLHVGRQKIETECYEVKRFVFRNQNVKQWMPNIRRMDIKIFVNCSGMTCSAVITTRDLKRKCFTFCTEGANPWLAKKII